MEAEIGGLDRVGRGLFEFEFLLGARFGCLDHHEADVPMMIGVVAPSSVVATDALQRGVKFFKSNGFKVDVHPQCKQKHLFFAGGHEARARALFDYAMRPDLSLLWLARGGYGAIHLLPYLEQWTRIKGAPPKKLLVGFSDATALLEFAREVWGWSVLHGPMVSSPGLSKAADPLLDWVRLGFRKGPYLAKKKLSPVWLPHALGSEALRTQGVVVGGNLSVWASLAGTPHQGFARDRILFLEDIGETPSRMDRAFAQLVQSRCLEGVRALVLGTFTDCDDVPPKEGKRALRSVVSLKKALQGIFGAWGETHGVSVWSGLPVGHGPNGLHPLPLSARMSIAGDGRWGIEDWDWTGAV